MRENSRTGRMILTRFFFGEAYHRADKSRNIFISYDTLHHIYP